VASGWQVTGSKPDVPDFDPADDFRALSEEYAQALEALKAIVQQTEALMLMGAGDQLKGFLDQFVTMATGASAKARDKGLSQFVEWFDELVVLAEDLRTKHLAGGTRPN